MRFRRQHPIDVYIVDFYCHAARLVIELDGKIHLLQKEYDRERTKEINYFDIEILRFTNQEILSDIEKVISSIKKTVKNRLKKSFKF